MLRLGLKRGLESRLREAELRLRETEKRLALQSPERRISRLKERGTLLRQALNHAARIRLENEIARVRLAETGLNAAISRRTERAKHQLETTKERLTAISPLAVLKRGYALVYDDKERLLISAREAAAKRELRLQFADGRVSVTGKETEA